MKITNSHHLPAALYEAICRDEYSKQGKYSASEIPQPPQIMILKRRHDAEIVKDASDFLWLIQGKAIHLLLSHTDTSNALKEESLMQEIGGVTISGTTDLYDNDVADWKVTSVFSFLLGGLKPEWEAQTNIYAWLWQKHGFPVRDIYIHAILRDWSKSKSLQSDYPRIPFQTLKVPKWNLEDVEHYIKNRLGIYTIAEDLPDDAMPPCSLVEQWARPEQYAVKKEGRKSAVRVLNTLEEAEAMAKDKGGYVEHRPGKKVRCEDYCDARPFCWQYRAENPVATAEEFGFDTEEPVFV